MEFDLVFVWALIISFAVLVYVLLDGFDLGVGLLYAFEKDNEHRDLMMNSIAPVWDGNETWLVLGGGGLLAVFPLAYSVLLPALYAPIIAMLLGLVFRGVAFEYRGRDEKHLFLWNSAFIGGSFVAAFAQGVTLGALVNGIKVVDRTYAGGWWDWLTPFSVLTGFAVVAGYMLLGSTWLVMKLEGDVQSRMRKYAKISGIVTLVFLALFSLWTPLHFPQYLQNWISTPNIYLTWIVPALVLVIAYRLFTGLKNGKEAEPFFMAMSLFIVSFIGLGVSLFPNIIPPSISFWDAAAPDKSLLFTLVGAAVLIPTILTYTGFAYWVFRGKVSAEDGYH